MIRKPILLAIGILLSQSFLLGQGQNPELQEYITDYKDIAIREMERAGIPASIKLAQGILESDYGRSYLARTANNHFGIKCGNDWNGKTAYKKDDDYNSAGKLVESCFRSYSSVEAGYVEHSEFLRDPKKHQRYGSLFKLDHTDYRRWAHGLKSAGYATSSTYPQKLIDLIERYELYKFDRMSTIDMDTPGEEFIAGLIMVTNDVKYTVATPQETVAEVAQRTRVALDRLMKYNESLNDGNQVLREGQKVFIQHKRNYYRGRQKYHPVGPDETIQDIANMYAIKLPKLYRRNLLTPGEEPAPGAQIKLRGGKVGVKPKLRRPGEMIRRPDPVIAEPGRDDFPSAFEGDNGSRPITPYRPPANTSQPEANPLPPANSFQEPVAPAKTQPAPSAGYPAPAPAPVDETVSPTAPKPASHLPPPVVISKPSGTSPAAPATYHTVIAGDTLNNIAQRYGITVSKLVELNRLTTNQINIGQVLRIK